MGMDVKKNNMKQLEKIILGALILLSSLTLIIWTIGFLWCTPDDGIVANILRCLVLGVVIAFSSYVCLVFYNQEIN